MTTLDQTSRTVWARRFVDDIVLRPKQLKLHEPLASLRKDQLVPLKSGGWVTETVYNYDAWALPSSNWWCVP